MSLDLPPHPEITGIVHSIESDGETIIYKLRPFEGEVSEFNPEFTIHSPDPLPGAKPGERITVPGEWIAERRVPPPTWVEDGWRSLTKREDDTP